MSKVNCNKYRKKATLNLYIEKDLKNAIVDFCDKNEIKPSKLLSELFGNNIQYYKQNKKEVI